MAEVLNLYDVMRDKARRGDDYGAGVVSLIIQECDIAGLLDWKTLNTTEISNKRSNSIPEVGFREGRGATFSGVAGDVFDEWTDSVWHLGAQVDIDVTDLNDEMAGDVLGDRTQQAVKGMSWTFLDYFINGDHATDPYGFEGLKVRLSNSPSGQVVYGDTSSSELDMRMSASPTEDDMYQFLDRIDEAIDAADGHMADIALTSSDFIATLRSVLRRLGKYTEHPVNADPAIGSVSRRTSADKPNKPVLVYPEHLGIKWYDMGFKADQSTRVVENETVNSQDTRPVYFVKLGHPYLYGIQQYPIRISEPRILDDGVTYRTTIDWPTGLHHVHNKSVSKLAGVRVA